MVAVFFVLTAVCCVDWADEPDATVTGWLHNDSDETVFIYRCPSADSVTDVKKALRPDEDSRIMVRQIFCAARDSVYWYGYPEDAGVEFVQIYLFSASSLSSHSVDELTERNLFDTCYSIPCSQQSFADVHYHGK